MLMGGNLAVAEFFPVVAVIAGVLAVTTWRYPDMPKHYLRNRRLLWQPGLLFAGGLQFGFGRALLVFFVLYALVGPVLGRRRRVLKSAAR
jgi:hypothetical protein